MQNACISSWLFIAVWISTAQAGALFAWFRGNPAPSPAAPPSTGLVETTSGNGNAGALPGPLGPEYQQEGEEQAVQGRAPSSPQPKRRPSVTLVPEASTDQAACEAVSPTDDGLCKTPKGKEFDINSFEQSLLILDASGGCTPTPTPDGDQDSEQKDRYDDDGGVAGFVPDSIFDDPLDTIFEPPHLELSQMAIADPPSEENQSPSPEDPQSTAMALESDKSIWDDLSNSFMSPDGADPSPRTLDPDVVSAITTVSTLLPQPGEEERVPQDLFKGSDSQRPAPAAEHSASSGQEEEFDDPLGVRRATSDNDASSCPIPEDGLETALAPPSRGDPVGPLVNSRLSASSSGDSSEQPLLRERGKGKSTDKYDGVLLADPSDAHGNVGQQAAPPDRGCLSLMQSVFGCFQ